MFTTGKDIFRFGSMLFAFAAALCFAACSDDADEQGGDRLHLLSYASPFYEVPASRAVTVPTGYNSYIPTAPSAPAIGVFLTPYDKDVMQTFQWTNGSWDSEIRVREDDYYIYGFMPTSAVTSASIAPLPEPNVGDFSDGAVLTLHGVPTLCLNDLCVAVGIKGVTSPSVNVDLTSQTYGNFHYALREKGSNYLYMLFNHLYSALQFSICIDANYATLRTIRLKSMTLRTAAANAADIDVTITGTLGTIDPLTSVSYTLGESTGVNIPMFTSTGTSSELLLTTSYQNFGNIVYLIPHNSIRSSLVLESTYDVYDRKGNLVREGCTAINQIKNIPVGLSMGQKKNIRLTVNPTYLYQLSEPELDNPTISIAN